MLDQLLALCHANRQPESSKYTTSKPTNTRFVIPTFHDRKSLDAELEQIKETDTLSNEHKVHKNGFPKRKPPGRVEYLEQLYQKASENNAKTSNLVLETKNHVFYHPASTALSLRPRNISHEQGLRMEENIKLSIKYAGFKTLKPIGVTKTLEQCLEESILRSEQHANKERDSESLGILRVSSAGRDVSREHGDEEEEEANHVSINQMPENLVSVNQMSVNHVSVNQRVANQAEQDVFEGDEFEGDDGSAGEPAANARYRLSAQQTDIPVLSYKDKDSSGDEANEPMQHYSESSCNNTQRSFFLESEAEDKRAVILWEDAAEE